MAEKTLKTRLLLKQDTLENWNSSTLALKKGEVVFATAAVNAGNGLTEPVVMAKVCTEDGKLFSQLPFSFYAKASDVYEWAKKEAIEFEKDGTGNVVSGLSFENGKVKYTTASVATSEGLATIQEEIANNKDQWAKDTTYTFAITDGKLVVTPSEGEATTLDFVTPDELTDALGSYATTEALTTELAKKQDSLEFNTEYNASSNKVATMTDVANATKALSGAMHFIGLKESVPSSYEGAAGDVILVGNKEYVYDGTSFVELGDESIYAVAGQIKNADIAADAAIEKTKLSAGVQASLGLADTAVQEADLDTFVKKADAAGYSDILTKTSAASTYATKADVNNKQDNLGLTKVGSQIFGVDALGTGDGELLSFDHSMQTAKLATSNFAVTIAADKVLIGPADTDNGIQVGNAGEVILDAKAYVGSAAENNEILTKSQIETAINDSISALDEAMLKSIAAGAGLKISNKSDNSQTISFDDTCTFILDCGDSLAE